MPHKRAKRSIRLSETAKKGSNLPPTTSSQSTSRSASRILNSHSIQSAFRASGRTTSEDTGLHPSKGKSKVSDQAEDSDFQKREKKAAKKAGKKEERVDGIRPGESLGDYNRRVEATLRGGVSRAIKAATSVQSTTERDRRAAKEARKRDLSAIDGETPQTHVEFAPIPAPRRLNDIVIAPPVLPHLRRGGGTKEDAWRGAFRATGRTPLSLGQARILEEERERVIRVYREMKEIRAGARVELEKGAEKRSGEKRKRVHNGT